MPSKSDTIPINNRTLDKRVKLSEEQVLEIISKYAKGQSLRSLAREYKVDKQTIKSKVDPKWYEEKLKERKDYQKQYRLFVIDKKTRNAYMRKHRAYKRELLEKGEI